MTEGDKIKFYSTVWCSGCRRAKKFLISKGIEIEEINIDQDQSGREFVMKVNNGYRSVPTIVFPDGDILVEPSNLELEKKISGL